MRKKFVFYADPGHAWMKVKRAELEYLGIKDRITSYSYQRGDDVFLEEDLDAGIFIKAMRERGFEIEFKEYHANKVFKNQGVRPTNRP